MRRMARWAPDRRRTDARRSRGRRRGSCACAGAKRERRDRARGAFRRARRSRIRALLLPAGHRAPLRHDRRQPAAEVCRPASDSGQVYVRFYPWFQRAYQDLGYPSGYFNDRLIDVIDNVLATPETSTPVALVQSHVLFEFANPDFEALSAGQKIMVRVGGENAAQIRIKLRELRRLLTGAISPP